MADNPRWNRRPAGSTWGDFGADDARGRLNLLTPEKVLQGIASEKAKEIVKAIKDRKLKVQASIQADQVRVAGRNKDDLQAAIGMLRAADFGVPLQFTNYR